MVRVYAAATGRCLFRDTADFNEAEQNRVSRYFRDGVRLAIEPHQQRVLGLLTIVRSTEEPFFFVADCDSQRPICDFYEQVHATCNARLSWDINFDRDESSALRTVVSEQKPPNELAVQALSENLSQSEPTKTYYNEYTHAVSTLSAVTRATDVDTMASGRILLSRDESISELTDLNHHCIVGSPDPSTTDDSNDPSRSASGLFGKLVERFLSSRTRC